MARPTPLLLALALGLLAALAGCRDTPSYRLRWDLQGRLDPTLDPDVAPALPLELPVFDVSKAYHCSQLGVTAVRVRAIDELGSDANVDIYPCFAPGFDDPDEKVEGPELRPGKYALEVRGVQRDLQVWIDDDPPPEKLDGRCEPDATTLGCAREDVACACQEFEAVQDETYSEFDTFRLSPAPEDCNDGIDNDIDGLVDVEDLGCRDRPLQESVIGDCGDGVDNDEDGRTDDQDADCYLHEGGDVSIIQFSLTATVLDNNSAATCGGVDLTRFRITAGEPDGEPFEVATTECRLGSPLFFSAELPALGGSLAVFVTGLDGNQPITMPFDTGVEVTPGSDAIVDLVVDFGAEMFEPPLVKSTAFVINYAQHPESTTIRKSCVPEDLGTLVIDRLSLQLLDLAGAPVPDATVRVNSMDAPLDGTPLPCDPSVLSTSALEWGGYRILGEALAADGTVCFTSEDSALLAPTELDEPAKLVLDRVLVDGRPPSACIDCTGDDDCTGENLACILGVCR